MRSRLMSKGVERLAKAPLTGLRTTENGPRVFISAPSGIMEPERLFAAWDWICSRHGEIGHAEIGTAEGLRPFGPQVGQSTATLTLKPTVIDAESVPVILEELAGHLLGQPAMEPPPDVSRLLAEMAERGRNTALAYPEEILSDPPPAEALHDMPVPDSASMRRVEVGLDEEATELLRHALAECGATLEQAVLAGWGIVEARWSGQAEVCLGLRVSLRGQETTTERAVGCLATTLPCILRFDPDVSLGEVLSDLRSQMDGIAAHAAIALFEAADTGKRALVPRTWQTMVQFTPVHLETRLQTQGRWPPGWTAKLALDDRSPVTLVATDGPCLRLELTHQDAQLPQAMADRMMGHLRQVLLAFGAGNCARRISEIEMMEPAEQKALLLLGEPHSASVAATPCLATRFEATAAQWPDEIALDDPRGPGRITYSQLDRQANGLAHKLADAGVMPGDVVALCLPRGATIVVAMLAVLKLGAVFLPIDPEQSEGWRKDMMVLTGARHLVLPAGKGIADTDTVAVEVEATPRSDPPSRPQPQADRGAYILFTSGSSGKPKAVLGITGALSAHADAVIAEFALAKTDRVLQFSGHTFDVFLEEVFPTLFVGGRVVFRDGQTASSASGFLDFVQRHGLTVLNLPAGFFHVIMQEITERGLALPASLRLLVAGSERVLPTDLRKLQAVAPGLGFINAYGPTETTITATAWRLPVAAPPWEPTDDVPIGRPLQHARIVLRAQDGTLTPRGGKGILWIGGAAVTGGYLGNPAHGEDSFQADPWHPGARLYRTGDMAQWREDDQLAFLGRADRQVKIRGHRIDLHQVEAAFLALPDLRQVHVGVDRTQAGDRLLAWFVCAPALSTVAVKAAIAQHLPDYMMPQLIRLEQLPRKPGGKIDIKALPRPSNTPTGSGEADELANGVAACMAEILGLESVGIDQDFRDIGGDSLLAIRLVGLVEQRLSFSLRPTDLMGFPTARGLADVIRSERIHAGCTVTIQAQGTQPALFAVHVLGRNESFFRPLAEALGHDFPVYGMSAGLPRSVEEVEVERLARWYFEEIQRNYPEGPVALAGFSLASYFAFEVAQLLRAAGREVCLLALIDMTGPDRRPELRGMEKLAVHLRQLRKYRLTYIGWLLEALKGKLPSLKWKQAAKEDEQYELVEANVRAVDAYKVQPYDGPITVFRAEASFRDSSEARQTGLGWASVAKGGIKVVDVPGTHMTMLERHNVNVMAKHIAQVLSRSQQDNS